MMPAPRIIAVNRFYWPDHSATSQLLTDLAQHLAAEGHEVVIVASRLRYDGPASPLPPRETHAGVRIHRVWTSHFGRHLLLGRAVDYATFYLTAFLALLRLARAGDTVIAKTDPPLISVVAWLAARLRRAELVNWCQDLFPEIAGALGLRWASGPVGGLLRILRNLSLRAARVNVVLCEPMRDRLLAEGVPASRIQVIHNWPDPGIRPIPPEQNGLRRAWGLEGRFVIGYSGNLGRAHLPERVAELVRRTADIPGLSWLFIGGGAGLAALRDASAAAGLANVVFQPYQPRTLLAESLSVPDLHLVTLDPACEGLIMPSKLYGVLAAGRPVFFLGSTDAAASRLLRSFDAGLTLSASDPASWRAVVETAAACSAWTHMGAAARLAADHTFRVEFALASWLKLLAGTHLVPIGHARAAVPN